MSRILPQEFLDRMKNILGEDYGRFLSAMDDEPVKGVRTSTLKCHIDGELEISGFGLAPLSYIRGGYILSGEGIGSTPEHHAGMIYAQDPGAMAALRAVGDISGMWVADLCAAPGGKASYLAQKTGESGFLLANEYVPKRAKILVGNLERLGVGHAIVTSLDTAELAKMLPEAFALVLCDVPCSGEGMFRKNEEAITEWTPEAPEACARRAKDILENGARMVAPGGQLLFSTCTWSVEENEEQIFGFLTRHPEFKIVPVAEERRLATADGLCLGGMEELRHTRRVYPHLTPGEGQYIALLQKDGEPPKKQTIAYKDATRPLNCEEASTVANFFRDTLISPPKGRLAKVGENIVLIPHGCPVPPRSVFMSGVLVGEIKGKTLHPSHHLLSVYGSLFKCREELAGDGDRLSAFLRGEEIATSHPDLRGFVAVCYRGAPLGLGKASGGIIKNHYPKGLRTK